MRRTALRLTGLFAILALVSGSSFLRAERKNLSEDEMRQEATHVVKGRVVSVYERTEKEIGRRVFRHLVEIEVESVEQGEGIEPGDLVYARMWSQRLGLFSRPTPGPSGHQSIPRGGENVRAFLVHGPYPATRQKDKGWAVVYPNGMRIR